MRAKIAIVLLVLGACRERASSVAVTADPIRVDPSRLDLGDTFLGFERTAEVSLSNPNKTPLAVELAATPPFTLSLAKGAVEGGVSLKVKVTFHPTELGPQEGTLTVNGATVALKANAVAVPICPAPPACNGIAFDPAIGQCAVTLLAEGTPCTSSFACYARAECRAGTCVGVLDACDDHDACTVDSCGAAGCAHTGPIACPPVADPCQSPICVPAQGCTSEPVADGTACGAVDCVRARVCINGACVSRPVPTTPICTDWEQEGYLKAFNTGAGDAFGHAVAVSGDGAVVAVSAWYEDSVGQGSPNNNSVFESGAVYLFEKSGLDWRQVAFVKASNPGSADRFGVALALSGDGTTLVVGADGEDSGATGVNGNQASNTAPNAGAAYVFVKTSAGWTQQAYLKSAVSIPNDALGSAVALSDSGDLVAAGAPGAAQQAGAVALFVRTNGVWAPAQVLTSALAVPGDAFGSAVALAADGSTVAASAPTADRVSVFHHGLVWKEDAVLPPVAPGTSFGAALALSANGARLAVGAPGGLGAVHVYGFASTWALTQTLTASNATMFSAFGESLGFAADGATLVVGASGEDSGGADSGAAYVFHQNGATWSQLRLLKASNREAQDAFGAATALSADGLTVVVGAVGESSSATSVDGNEANDTATYAGAAYVF